MSLDELLEEINHLQSELEELRPLSDENQRRLWKKIRLEFNYNSNHLEGNTLTYGQTELLLLYDKVAENSILSDLEQMKSHDVALSKIVEAARDPNYPLTEQFIKELNRLVLVRPFWKEAITEDGLPTRKQIQVGEYKSTPNSVRLPNGEIHEYASVQDTPIKMAELIQWYRDQENKLHPGQLAAQFHYQFVVIHPFDDGNGRVARLVMNYILIKHAYPPIIVKSSDKENYLTALQRADVGEKDAIDLYLLKELKNSMNLYIKAAKGVDLTEPGDLDKEITLLKRERLMPEHREKKHELYWEITQEVNDVLWSTIKKIVSKFDEFFLEESPSRDTIQIKSQKGLGVFSWEEISADFFRMHDVSAIHWKVVRNGLKYHPKKSLEASLKLRFNILKEVKISFRVNDHEPLEYSSDFTLDITEEFVQTFDYKVGNKLLSFFKNPQNY